MKLFSTILIIIFFICSAKGQTVLKKGYIINQSGDTTKGFIQDDVDQRMMDKAIFYEGNSKTAKQYGTNDIVEFGSKGRVFRRFNLVSNTVEFGKVANDGTLSLIVFRDEGKFKCFVKNNITGKSAMIEPLKKDNKLLPNNVIVSPEYVQKLFMVANLTAALKSLKTFPYKESTFRKFVTTFNNKSNPNTAKEYRSEIIYHNIFSYYVVNYTSQFPNAVSGFSYFFAKENRDRYRKGFWLFGARYQAFRETKTIPLNINTYEQKTSEYILLPVGYRYSPGFSQVKPYITASGGVLFNQVRGLSLTPLTPVHSEVTSHLILSVGAGLSIKLGKRYFNIESNCDFTSAGLYVYRYGVGIDI